MLVNYEVCSILNYSQTLLTQPFVTVDCLAVWWKEEHKEKVKILTHIFYNIASSPFSTSLNPVSSGGDGFKVIAEALQMFFLKSAMEYEWRKTITKPGNNQNGLLQTQWECECYSLYVEMSETFLNFGLQFF